MDWDITHSSLFTGAGLPGWLGGAGGVQVDWNPMDSEIFREDILPTLEIAGIATATILTGGLAPAAWGVAGALAIGGGAGALTAFGWESAESALNVQQHTFYAQVAPFLGTLVGMGWLANQPNPSTAPPAGTPDSMKITDGTLAPIAIPGETPAVPIDWKKEAGAALTAAGQIAAQYGLAPVSKTATAAPAPKGIVPPAPAAGSGYEKIAIGFALAYVAYKAL